MNQRPSNIRYMTQLALLIAVELVMKTLGLGSVPFGPLNMSFLTVPIAVGAIIMGPAAGAIMGGAYGIMSYYDAITGVGNMTAIFFQLDPVNTFILCAGTRILLGFCVGWIFKAARKLDKKGIVSYYLGALSAPLLNTCFFMGYIVLVFYQTEYIQNLVNLHGAVNPIHFIVALVGLQGLVEAVVCALVGGTVAKGVSRAFKR
ncbi:MAG: ECF transporter S component [Oscillospiraceae bacterium]|nr:ECF transporter S component [Oscillospiraceae bacterium]